MILWAHSTLKFSQSHPHIKLIKRVILNQTILVFKTIKPRLGLPKSTLTEMTLFKDKNIASYGGSESLINRPQND